MKNIEEAMGKPSGIIVIDTLPQSEDGDARAHINGLSLGLQNQRIGGILAKASHPQLRCVALQCHTTASIRSVSQ